MDGIAIREFARRDHCDEGLVRRAIRKGHLTTLPDGKLDPALVGSPWRLTNRRAADTADADNPADALSAPMQPQRARPPAPPLLLPQPGETPEEAAARIMLASGAPMALAEAERVKENYLALLRQLEYDTKSGVVVPVAEVAKAVGGQFAQVRTRILAIPAEQAPQLHRLKTVTELQDALRTMLSEALEALTLDRPAATAGAA
jgi:hypothetical protein